MVISEKVHNLLQLKAVEIHEKCKLSDFSVVIPLTIVSILISIYTLYLQCNKNQKETTNILHHPGLLERMVIRNVVHRSIPNQHDAEEVLKQILAMNKNTSEDEIQLLTMNKDD